MDGSRIVIIIPTYNERQNAVRLLNEIFVKLPRARVVMVDDNSPDGTADEVRKFSQADSRVKLLWRDKKLGLASAYMDAFARLIADPNFQYFVSMDADFSHQPKDLSKLLEHAQDHDLVVGSRYVAGGGIENWNWLRLAISQYGNLYARAITQVPVFDLTSGFVVYSRPILEQILRQEISSEGYAYQIEMKYLAHKARAKIIEVPITFADRSRGQSKLSRSIIFEGIIAPWRLRFFK